MIPPSRPRRIGPYEIRGVLGEGGMGIVYEALQTEPVRRRVALKLVRAGGASREVLQRFEAERQALAVMDHPHIAKVFDAGTTDAGEPYFAMELVQGVPLNTFCDQRRLGTWERLGLMVQVCDAVQHAHLKGVIHRDLKPSNILVSDADGTPRPKVIDFGIAKAVDQKLTRDTLATLDGSVLGTLAYMSPEQASGNGTDIDSRADVYALGVILYELLVGRLPLDPDELGVLPFIARLATGETRIPTPSAQLDRDGERVAALRREEVASLARRLRGDLDWIAMRAIEAERDRRYPTATSLAEDIERFLRDEPVRARPPSAGYRVRKFVQRNRMAVAAGAAAALILAVGTVATAVGFVRATRAEEEALAARERAEREAETARRVSDFLVGMFQSGDPGRAGGELTAREILDRGVASVEDELTDQPAVQGRLYESMADAYFGLGLWAVSNDLQERALAARERGLGPDHPDVARSLRNLMDIRIRQGTGRDDPEILAMAERSHAIGVEHRDEDPETWIGGVTNLTGLYAVSNREEEGREMVREALEYARSTYGRLDPRTLHLMDWSAKYEANVDNFTAAIPIFESMLFDREVRSAMEPTAVESMTANLGFMYGQEGMTDRSVELYEQALEQAQARWGEEARQLGDNLWNLAFAYSEAGRHGDAARTWRTYLEIEERLYGDDLSQTVRLRTNMGIALAEAGRYDEAEAALSRSLDIVIPLLDDQRRGESVVPPFFDTVFGYALLLARAGRGDEVDARILQRIPDDPERWLEVLWHVAGGLENGGDVVAAIRVHDRRAQAALRRTVARGTPDDGEVRGAFIQNALVRLRAGDADGLLQLAPRWTAAMERLPGSPPGPVLQSHHDMSYHLFVGEHRDGIDPIPELRPRALEPVLRAVSFQEAREGSASPALLRQLAPLQLILEYRGEPAEAQAVRERARRLVRARTEELVRTTEAGEETDPGAWNFVCWWGSLAGAADDALAACQRGVEAVPGDASGGVRDSRAVALAVLGRLDAAARDFRFALDAGTYSRPVEEQRRRWLEALERGENPLDLEALATLAF